MTPEWMTDREASDARMHRVAPFVLTDQRGATITESALRGRITIVHFFFARCGDVCPTTTANVARVVAEAGAMPELQVLSHSVTPERDSVPVLQHFAAMHKIADPRWHLLTGDTATIHRLARDSYFVRLGDGRTFNVASIAHTESVLLIDGEGRLRGIYAGTLALEMQRLREDIATLHEEQVRQR
jgi:protein SCO1/2